MDGDLSGIARDIELEINSGFPDIVLDHAMNPRNIGRIENADGFSAFTGPCGDTMMISTKVSSGKIPDAGFSTDGCGTSIASGSMVTEPAKGKTLDET